MFGGMGLQKRKRPLGKVEIITKEKTFDLRLEGKIAVGQPKKRG